MTMTKAGIINSVYERTGVTKKEATDYVEAVLETMKEALESGNDIKVSGFGKFEVRANRCAGSEGEQRDDIYYIWIGLQAVARGNDAARVINEVHARWQEAGWEVTRHRELANGGVNLAATEPGSGDAYALDSGFDKGPDSYVVGFFNTPCFQSPSGDVQYGEIRHGLEGASAAP